MASAMRVATTPYIVTAPCDSPFLPTDFVERLWQRCTQTGAAIAVASDGERMQPVFALIACHLRPSLEAFLARGERKIDRWFADCGFTTADFADRPRTFININSPEDITQVEAELRHGHAPA
jgi:molybdopterin-guanine dinucleotide biosynthesis protein A